MCDCLVREGKSEGVGLYQRGVRCEEGWWRGFCGVDVGCWGGIKVDGQSERISFVKENKPSYTHPLSVMTRYLTMPPLSLSLCIKKTFSLKI